MDNRIWGDMMVKDITESNWIRFCERFTEANLFRPVAAQLITEVVMPQEPVASASFLGMSVVKPEGANDTAITLSVKLLDPESLKEREVAMRQPTKLLLERDTYGYDSYLVIEGRDGIGMSVRFAGSPTQGYQSCVSTVAYRLSQLRGFQPGQELNDWLEAERKVQTVKHLSASTRSHPVN